MSFCRFFLQPRAFRKPLGGSRGAQNTRRFGRISSPLQQARIVQATATQLPTTSGSFARRVTIPLEGKPTEFESIFLRDSCKCSSCVDASSSQKNFQTCDIPADIEGAFVGTVTNEHGIESAVIRWNKDAKDYTSEHNTQVPLELLRKTVAGDLRQTIAHFNPDNRVFWDRKRMTRDNLFVDFNEYLETEEGLYKVIKQLESHGLVFLRGIPDCVDSDSSKGVSDVVNRIGPLRTTFYGNTWNVRSEPKAINVAYTHQYLGLHVDLCYLDLTPQFQFLHSLRARAPGGESIFSDSFLAAQKMRRQYPELFESLVTFPITFHYYNIGLSYRQIRTTIELSDPLDLNSPIKVLNWSPPFQGPLAIDTGRIDGGTGLKRYIEASQKFDELVSLPESLFELRMNEGECVIFDNRRTLHARRAFDPARGERWLKGAYMDRDAFASKLARLDERFGV